MSKSPSSDLRATCSSAKLRDAIAIAARVLGAKATMPVLSCICLRGDSKSKRISVTATNLDIWITTSFPAEVNSDGAVCIMGRRFLGIAAAVEGETAEIEVSPSRKLTFKCGRSTFNLLGIGAEEFPNMAAMPDDVPSITFDQEGLATIVAAVSAAQSDDETRYVLNAVHVERAKKSMHLVATDGRRLHVSRVETDASVDRASIIIPKAAIAHVSSLLDDGKVTVSHCDRSTRFLITRADGDVTLITKNVEGGYPAWRQVLPKKEGKGVTVNRKEMLAAVSRAKLATSEKSSSVRLNLEPLNIEIVASSPDVGEARELLSCKNPDGLSGAIAINARYLMDAISSATEDEVTFFFSKDNMEVAPLCLRQGDHLEIVVMPVRLS